MTQKIDVEIVNRLGLHARAAAKFVTLASGFESNVRLLREDREVNGKSIMGVMMLAAGKGAQLTIVAEGADAGQAIAELAKLVNSRFGEDE